MCWRIETRVVVEYTTPIYESGTIRGLTYGGGMPEKIRVPTDRGGLMMNWKEDLSRR